jgi:hypothetical protein
MKSAKVNAKGLSVWLWLSTNGKSKNQLPYNFCDFFWASVLCYPIAIFAWPGHLINLLTKDTSKTKAWPWMFHTLIAIAVYNGFFVAEHHPFVASLMGYVWGLIILLGFCVGILILVLITAGMIEIRDYIAEKKRDKRIARRQAEWDLKMEGKWVEPIRKERKPSGFITWWKSFKGKYCPKIEYYNLEKEYEDKGFCNYSDGEVDDYNHNSEHEI